MKTYTEIDTEARAIVGPDWDKRDLMLTLPQALRHEAGRMRVDLTAFSRLQLLGLAVQADEGQRARRRELARAVLA